MDLYSGRAWSIAKEVISSIKAREEPQEACERHSRAIAKVNKRRKTKETNG